MRGLLLGEEESGKMVAKSCNNDHALNACVHQKNRTPILHPIVQSMDSSKAKVPMHCFGTVGVTSRANQDC